MNQTTIVINWKEPIGLINAMSKIARLSQVNTYSDESISIYTKFENIDVPTQKRFTSEALAIVLDHFGARNKDRSNILPSVRRLAWYYVLKNYPKATYKQIGEVSGHDHSSILSGYNTCVSELKTKCKNYTKDMRDEVFAKCDEVFKNKQNAKDGINQ